MLKKIEWHSQIGRRLHLRQLHVFSVVAERGSMAKAATHLGVSTPTVSEIIADLEHAIGVRLLDREPRGIEPTSSGRALLERIHVVFDELSHAIQDIELLADPTAGEISLACPLGIAFSIMPHIFERFAKKFPRVVLHFDEVTADSTTRDLRALRDRRYDLLLGRGGLSMQIENPTTQDLNIETLFDDELVIVAGARSKWANRRRRIDIADLVDEPWILQPSQTGNYRILAQAFRKRGLPVPRANLVTLSMSVITHFLANGLFITAIPRSVASFSSLKTLPVDLPAQPWPVNIVTLKNRTLSAATKQFIECARDFAKTMQKEGLNGRHNRRV
jgi:DNA-binding transcriptional LysR family regulator